MSSGAPNPPPGEGPGDTLTLAAALKLAGFAETGGQAKRMIQAGDVLVNGSVETRRKHKLRPGDEITIADETFVVELADDELEDDEHDDDTDDDTDAPRA